MPSVKATFLILLCAIVSCRHSTCFMILHSRLTVQRHVTAPFVAMNRANDPKPPSVFQKVRHLLAKKAAGILTAASLSFSVLVPASALAAGRNKQPTALEASQVFVGDERHVGGKSAIADEQSATIEFHVKNDKDVAKKQGQLLNRVGLGLLAVNVVYTLLKKDGATTKRGKDKLSKGKTIRAPKALNVEEDKLKSIMSKLDETLKEQEQKDTNKKIGKSISTPAKELDDMLTQEVAYEESTISRKPILQSFSVKSVDDLSISPPAPSEKERKDYSPYTSKRPKGLSAKIAAVAGSSASSAVTSDPILAVDSAVTVTSRDISAEEDLSTEDQTFLESIGKDTDIRTPSENTVSEETKPPEKKGIFDRIFKKTTSSLAIDLGDLLSREDKAQIFCVATAKAISSLVPDDVFPELRGETSADQNVELVLKAKSAAGLTDQEATDAYAEVVNCMIAALVDRAVDTLDLDDAVTVEALDKVVSFMDGAGGIFAQVANGCKPKEAVIYNGNSKKGKLENLYYKYAKSSMSLKNILSGLSTEDSPSVSSNGVEDVNNSFQSAEAKMARLQQVTQVLAIKESKKESLDMKIMREVVMSMTKGEGLGDLSGLLGALGGAGGGGDPGQIEDLLGKLGNIDPTKLKEMQDMMGVEGLPNLDNMDPSKMADMSKQAFSDIKSALAEGSMNREDILEFEKLMGTDLETLLRTMKQGIGNERAMKEMLGSDMKEMLNLFQQLVDIKKKDKRGLTAY